MSAFVQCTIFAAGVITGGIGVGLFAGGKQEELRSARDRYRQWWERDSAAAITAKAELDLIHEQRRAAGRLSHKAERALFDKTTDMLRQCVERRDTQPVDPEPAGFPADRSAGPIRSGRGGLLSSRAAGQDTGAGFLPDVTPRASAGNEPGRSCRRNRAGHSAPAETPKMKGIPYG